MAKKTHCLRGHARIPENVYQGNKQYCLICKREKVRAKRNEAGMREMQNAYHRKWRTENPDKARAAQQRYRYGKTPEEIQELLTKQNHSCAICLSPFINGNYHIDHVHDTTQKVRGLLCHFCNTGLGSFKDSAESLQSAIEYLKQ